MLDRVTIKLIRFSTKWVPSSFSIALILTIITILLTLIFTTASPINIVIHWGNGFWELLTFAMQMCLIIYTGYIIAVSPPVGKLLKKIADLPRSPRQVILVMSISSLFLCWVNWGLGLIASAILAAILAQKHKKINIKLLVAVSYLGMGVTWHAGLSGSVHLLLATPGNFLESMTGLISIHKTIFHPFNLITTASVSLIVLIFGVYLHPKKQLTEQEIESEKISTLSQFIPPERPFKLSPADWIDFSPMLNIFFGLMGIVYLSYIFFSHGLNLTLNNVNLIFLTFGILLHKTPRSLLTASKKASKVLHGIVLQFPLYAGIYGIIKDSGLAIQISHFFINISNINSFPTIVFFYSSILNYFVPSGGSKWAIEAPYLITAAKSLGVKINKIAIAYAMGDMSSNLIQPFWSIPLLSVTGLKFKDILGYEILFFVIYVVLTSITIFLLF